MAREGYRKGSIGGCTVPRIVFFAIVGSALDIGIEVCWWGGGGMRMSLKIQWTRKGKAQVMGRLSQVQYSQT